MRLANYPVTVEQPPLDDDRGVDVARIRELLAMTAAQRVEHMVQVVNALQAVASRAKASRA